MRSAHGDDTHLVKTLLVDQRNKLGFNYGNPDTPSTGVAMYDLESMAEVATITRAEIQAATGATLTTHARVDTTQWALDEANQRILGLPTGPGTTLGGCDKLALDYFHDGEEWRFEPRRWRFPCPPQHDWDVLTLSFDQRSGKAYASIKDLRQASRSVPANNPGLGTDQGFGDPLIVAQVDVSGAEPVLDWYVDLLQGGCGRRDFNVLWVARVPGAVLSYCYDDNPWRGLLGLGNQGYLVAVPMEGDQPRSLDGGSASIDPVTRRAIDAAIRRTPTLPGRVSPFADPTTGMALLLTSGRPNGNAFWVFDPRAERFVGSVTGGVVDEPALSNAAGFDPGRSRGYLLTAEGILLAPLGRVPLPAGELFPVVTNPGREPEFIPTWTGGRNDRIAVVTDVSACGGCTRLFVPTARAVPCSDDPEERCAGYVVVDDHVLDPAIPTPEPRFVTAQVDEEPGKTDRIVSGRALVAGAQVLVTGGVPRTVDQASPTCVEPPIFLLPAVQNVIDQVLEPFNDGCAAEVAVTPGHRQIALAWTDVDVGSAIGATVDASGLAVTDEDAATEPELKRLGECHASTTALLDEGGTTWESSTGAPFPFTPACDGVRSVFRALTGDDLQRGTAGGTDDDPGRGFPVPASHCGDFGTTPSDDTQPETPEALRGAFFDSSASCDASQVAARGTASASAAAFSLPSPEDPLVSVARTAIDGRSLLTHEGQITVAVAAAYGVSIGPLKVGEVRSVAVSQARGRTTTAHSELTRLWCGVSFDDEPVEDGCLDATSDQARALTNATNQALGRARISVPAAHVEATEDGFEAVVTKDEDVRGADQTVNDDDSHTVPAMQVTAYNDGARGRNRYVVQLAGVHTEARYGIIVLPQFSSPGFGGTGWQPEATLPSAVAGVPGTPGTPGRVEVVEEILERSGAFGGGSGDGSVLARPEQPDSLFRRVLGSPVETARAGLHWLRNNPREAALLFLLWSVLATPVYLGIRRRSFEHVLAQQRLLHQEPSP